VAIVALATTAPAEMLEQHVERVHIQLQRMPATRVHVVAAALATTALAEMLEQHVERVHIQL
jgi:glycerate-2-kinase